MYFVQEFVIKYIHKVVIWNVCLLLARIIVLILPLWEGFSLHKMY